MLDQLADYSVEVAPDMEEHVICVGNKWAQLQGHQIKVNDYRFVAIPIQEYFFVFELTSGSKVFIRKEPPEVESYEDVMQCMERYGIELVQLIEQNKVDFTEKIEKAKREIIKLCGERPAIKVMYN